MKFKVFNETDYKIDEIKKIEEVLEYAIKKESLKEGEFNVIIVDNEYILSLNKDYRNKDYSTDVITFALEDEKNMVGVDNYRILGDIFISIDKAKEQANEYNHSLERELCFLAVHGFYHLLGYDHETVDEEEIMNEKQNIILNEKDIRR